MATWEGHSLAAWLPARKQKRTFRGGIHLWLQFTWKWWDDAHEVEKMLHAEFNKTGSPHPKWDSDVKPNEGKLAERPTIVYLALMIGKICPICQKREGSVLCSVCEESYTCGCSQQRNLCGHPSCDDAECTDKCSTDAENCSTSCKNCTEYCFHRCDICYETADSFCDLCLHEGGVCIKCATYCSDLFRINPPKLDPLDKKNHIWPL